jgi:thiamine kinase
MVEDLPDSRTRELRLAEALFHVPGYRPVHLTGDPGIEVTRLSGGSVNRSYSVFTPAGKFVLRLSQGPDAWLTSDRSAERVLQRIASKAKIAPRIVAADDNDWWMVTEYVSGRLWMEPDFANPERLARLGDTLRCLHELPPPDVGRFDLLKALSGYVERVGADGDYLDWAAAAWRVSGADERPLTILHHDLHGSNLIETAERLVLIDWECAAVSDPLLDVACILSYHESARPYAPLLLQRSGLQDVTSHQLAAAVWLFDLHTYLWYRERRLHRPATGAEREAEEQLAERLPRTLAGWLPKSAN